MIKLKEVLSGITYDPFSGKLYEGLIYSLDVRTAVDKLQTAGFEASVEEDDEYIVELSLKYPSVIAYKYTSGNFYDTQISKLLQLSNNLGYFPSMLKYLDEEGRIKGVVYSSSKLKQMYYDNEPKKIWIIFNKKFDKIVEKKDLPDVIYHITSSDKINKIKSIGLKPASKAKKKFHPERIFFCLGLNDVRVLKDNAEFEKYDTLISIQTSTMPTDINFYYDPDFYGRGIYTYNNIAPKYIISIDSVDSIDRKKNGRHS